jgi:hypothetical protein
MSITTKQYEALVDKLQRVHDDVLVVKTNTATYNAQDCARRGLQIKGIWICIGLLFTISTGTLVYIGAVPNIKRPPAKVETPDNVAVNP